MKISVIMPIYNVKEYLESSVKSVFSGGVEDIELIAVDDLSSDGTREILASLAEKEPRIKAVFNEKNMGVARVRNLALSLASGDFIAFCDSDDAVPSGAYRAMLDAACGCDIVIGAYADVRDTGETTVINIQKRDKRSPFLALLSCVGLWHKLIRREFIVKNGLNFDTDMKIGEDVVFLSHVAALRPRYRVIDTVVYHYRNNTLASTASLTHKYNYPSFCEHIKCREKMLDICKGEYPECESFIYNYFTDYLDDYIPKVLDKEEQEKCYKLYKDFMMRYDWKGHRGAFLANCGMDYEYFKNADLEMFLRKVHSASPRERVYNEFMAGKIGFRWIIKFTRAYVYYKFHRKGK